MAKDTEFYFSPHQAKAADRFLLRFFSIVPGALSWFLLGGMIALSVFKPIGGAIVIIAYYIYWLFRLFYMTLFLILAYGVLAVERQTNWRQRCRLLALGARGIASVRGKMKTARKVGAVRQWLALWNQERDLRRVIRAGIQVPDYDGIYQLVIIAASKEGREILEPGLKALAASRFPARRMIPVLAVEARAGAGYGAMAQELAREYRKYFFDLLVAVHPDGIEGEARVKGANVTFAARTAARFFTEKGIDFRQVLVSCFDADTVAGPDYFNALTYHFMRHPKREQASYQPIPVYDNNLWEVTGFSRVLEMGSSFFQLVEATNPEKLVTFSSHSMSFKALVEAGYWPVDMISDDSAIFWKALLHYRGDYRVIPLYVTLSMDAVSAGSLGAAIRQIYRQKRRWAWGVENFPLMMLGFLKTRSIGFGRKFRYAVKLLEMHVSWATVGFFVTAIGWLPVIFASREFSDSVLFYHSARITGLIFNLASAGLLVMIVLSYLLLPRTPLRIPLGKKILFGLEWLLVPLVFTLLSTLPALDAQTRLMTARTIDFSVTEKSRGKTKEKARSGRS